MLAGNLFHFKKDRAEYNIKQEDHGSKPLFSKKGASQTLLSEFFFYVLSRVSSWQCMTLTELRVTTLDDVNALLLRSFYGPLQESKSGKEMPKVPVVSRYFVAYVASFVAVAPFYRAKDERVQTGTVKFYDNALSKLAGIKNTALSAFLHCKATAWYKRFPPIHSPDRREDPKTTVAMGQGGRPRTRRMSRIAPWRRSLHRMRLTTKAGNEARSAQPFLQLSDIAWYIAAGRCRMLYTTFFIRGAI